MNKLFRATRLGDPEKAAIDGGVVDAFGSQFHLASRHASSPRRGSKHVRRNLVSRSDRPFDFNEERIFNITQNYKRYEMGTCTPKDLKKFDDCEPYGVPNEEYVKLLRKEIRKLVESASREEPYLFDSNGHLQGVSSGDFHDISNIVDQIQCNFAIISHDNSQIAVEKMGANSLADSIKQFKFSRKVLLRRYAADEDQIEGNQPILLEPPSRNRELYHAMVDYVLGTIARYWVRCAVGRYWQQDMFAVLAAWAVKLKVTAYDLVENARISLATGEDILDEFVSGGLVPNAVSVKVKKAAKGKKGWEEEILALNERDDLTSHYYMEKEFFRGELEALFYSVVDGLAEDKSRRFKGPVGGFESCQLVYRTGLSGFTTSVSNNRRGHLSCTSERMQISFIYSGVLLMMTNLRGVMQREAIGLARREVGARFTWKWYDEGETSIQPEGAYDLTNMDDIVTLVVAQTLATPSSAVTMASAVYLVSTLFELGAEDDEPILQFEPPPRQFQAVFQLATEEFRRNQQSFGKRKYQDPFCRSLFEGPLKHGIRGKVLPPKPYTPQSYYCDVRVTSSIC